MSLNKISKDDENFLKEFLKEFYRQIIKIENYTKYENILMEWIKEFLNYNEEDLKKILKLMEDHEEKENWFSSLIGFFYEYGINNDDDDDDNDDDDIIIDKNKSFKLYLLSINNYENDKNNKKLISIYQLLNIIISKYLLSFYYYKDILYKRNIIIKEFKSLENTHVMSYNQFENFNGLEINLCKDEINSMEKYFESTDKSSNDYDNKKELMELNNLGSRRRKF
ncbi:unnamed protein product [Rhizophagus irregularis]|nr:unnamed protein product [Rhizophagus irregularis]CAB5366864.1 unnamed protein product [Rhizophagus irregularis]